MCDFYSPKSKVRIGVTTYRAQRSRILVSYSDKYEHQFGTQTKELFMLGNLPFYNFLNQSNSTSLIMRWAFQKNGQQYHLFDYEQLVYDTLQNHKHVWIKKATGLGITEFMLRYMAWVMPKR